MMPLDVSSAPPQTTPRETRLADYRPPSFLVDTAELAFDLDEAKTHLLARLKELEVVEQTTKLTDAELARLIGRRQGLEVERQALQSKHAEEVEI